MLIKVDLRDRRSKKRTMNKEKIDRDQLSIQQLVEMFPDDATAEAWFIETRCLEGIRCPHCERDRILEKSHQSVRDGKGR